MTQTGYTGYTGRTTLEIIRVNTIGFSLNLRGNAFGISALIVILLKLLTDSFIWLDFPFYYKYLNIYFW